MGLYVFFWVGNHIESNVRFCAALKWPEKLNSWKSRRARAPVPLAGDANAEDRMCDTVTVLLLRRQQWVRSDGGDAKTATIRDALLAASWYRLVVEEGVINETDRVAAADRKPTRQTDW